MGGHSAHRRGTTLAELLVAVVFIGICASVLLNAVGSTQTKAVYAKRRTLMLAQAQSEIELVRAQARTAALTTGNTTTSPTVAGFVGTLSQVRTIALVSGYTNLYRVNVTITWVERTTRSSRADNLSLETYMRAPDA